MVSRLDLEDCTQFWDCPQLCLGAKPLAKPKQKKQKKAVVNEAARKQPKPGAGGVPEGAEKPIEIPNDLTLEQLLEIRDVLKNVIKSGEEPDKAKVHAPLRKEDAYKAELAEQAMRVEELTGNPGWAPAKPDVDGHPSDRKLQLSSSKTSPKCYLCDRDAEPLISGGWQKHCWVHGMPIKDQGQRRKLSIFLVVLAALAAMLIVHRMLLAP